MARTVVFVASRTLSNQEVLPWAFRELIRLAQNEPGSTISLRKPKNKPANAFGLAMATAASNLDLMVRWWPAKEGGRQATFLRDVEMVTAADEVIAYFAEGEEMGEHSGTGHVVEKALDQAVPCRAYAIVEGTLKWVGGYDPEDQL